MRAAGLHECLTTTVSKIDFEPTPVRAGLCGPQPATTCRPAVTHCRWLSIRIRAAFDCGNQGFVRGASQPSPSPVHHNPPENAQAILIRSSRSRGLFHLSQPQGPPFEGPTCVFDLPGPESVTPPGGALCAMLFLCVFELCESTARATRHMLPKKRSCNSALRRQTLL